MTTPNSPLLETTAQGVITLTLNRPAVRNALNLEMLEMLEAAVLRIAQSPDIRLVVIKGAGEAFMAGGDIKHFEDTLQDGDQARTFSLMLDRINLLVQLMRNLPQPIVAAVQGACAGFGVSLALASDLIIATEDARFTLAYGRLGLTPDGGASWHLVHTLGLKRASALILLGETLNAQTAEQWGMINRIVPTTGLDAAVQQMADHLRAGAPKAQARAKQLLNYASELNLAAQLHGEAEHFAQLTLTPDFAEGVKAFLAKRPPNFTGE